MGERALILPDVYHAYPCGPMIPDMRVCVDISPYVTYNWHARCIVTIALD